ncbi:triacylglycerol lipase [Allohahella marinimesophila]|uniref:Triacylglycerol lipase n=1 Tax=Allohahella marinimesophila TaxID=1054972 RepID=A0ABP7PG48_9GAMM
MKKLIAMAAIAASCSVPASQALAACSAWSGTGGGYTDTQNPILLVHGVSGFSTVGGLIGYFHTIPLNLCRSGADVKVASVSAFNYSEQRGQQLANDINNNRYGSGKFNIMAHSQGAPTSRAAITFDASRNGWGNGRIKSVTSVHGVNKGSKTADALNGLIPTGVQGGIAGLANAVGGLINLLSGASHSQDALAALKTLTTNGTNDLNSRHGYGVSSGYCTNDRASQVSVRGNNIKLYSWSGDRVLTNVLDVTDPFLGITSLPFGWEQSDGLVAECSQRMGYHIGARAANHVDAVNHLFGARELWHDPIAMYRQQANRLKNAGL